MAAKRLYVSTDWWTDVDDAVAVRFLCWAQYAGLISIQGWDINTTLSNGPASLDALLRFEGFRNSVISRPLTSHVPGGAPPYQANLALLPHDVGDISTVEDAVTMYRRGLAGQSGRVEILSIGYLNNLQELLASSADVHSPLTGAALVAAKVSKLWIMGGNWPSGDENNFNRTTQAKTAASYVCTNWPTPITFVGYETASGINTGQTLRGSADPLAQALVDHGSSAGRPSWDIMASLIALADPASIAVSSVRGYGSVNGSTGANTWVTDGAGPHTYSVIGGSASLYQEMWRGILNRTSVGRAFVVP